MKITIPEGVTSLDKVNEVEESHSDHQYQDEHMATEHDTAHFGYNDQPAFT